MNGVLVVAVGCERVLAADHEHPGADVVPPGGQAAARRLPGDAPVARDEAGHRGAERRAGDAPAVGPAGARRRQDAPGPRLGPRLAI